MASTGFSKKFCFLSVFDVLFVNLGLVLTKTSLLGRLYRNEKLKLNLCHKIKIFKFSIPSPFVRKLSQKSGRAASDHHVRTHIIEPPCLHGIVFGLHE